MFPYTSNHMTSLKSQCGYQNQIKTALYEGHSLFATFKTKISI